MIDNKLTAISVKHIYPYITVEPLYKVHLNLMTWI